MNMDFMAFHDRTHSNTIEFWARTLKKNVLFFLNNIIHKADNMQHVQLTASG